MTTTFDAVVIGAGPGGYVAAIRLSQLGKKTALVEKESLGGVSLHSGCIPSKALIAAANLVEDLRGASERGLAGEPRCARQCTDDIDVAKLHAFKDELVKKLARGVARLEKTHGVEVIRGSARFVSANAIDVEAAGGATRLEAQAFVIATGARPTGIPGLTPDGQEVWSVRDAVDLREIPQRLVVVGGSAIGLEIATAYAKLGSEVTLIEARPSILSGIDADAVRLVDKGLRQRAVTVHVGARAIGLDRAGAGLGVRVEVAGREQVIRGDKVLVAAGSRPNSDRLGLEAAGVKVGEHGFVEVNDRMQTSVPGIYAVGDVTGPPFLAHKASSEGEVAAEVIAGLSSARDWLLPHVVFTDPEVAAAGLSEEQARAHGYDPVVGKFAFSALGRALAIRRAEGFVKVVADRDSKLLLGTVIAGPQACDLIAEATLALGMSASLEDVAFTVHAHPTMPEAFMEACKVALGTAIHAVNRPSRRGLPARAALVHRVRGVRR